MAQHAEHTWMRAVLEARSKAGRTGRRYEVRGWPCGAGLGMWMYVALPVDCDNSFGVHWEAGT